ncbi:hypothetical protein GCM10009836_03200 [Pseudonocardia ailaonensis]|uniref:DUF932 domain-containing protein n=1 Tax=Pseudonocardia ailaonensis TaxID=367279 RepID=A0ABN2MIR8_9PSEU
MSDTHPTDPAGTDLLVGRNARLPEIVDVLRAQQEVKLDVVAPARDLRAFGGDLLLAGGDHSLSLDGVTRRDATLTPTSAADGDLAAKLGIPLAYLRRLRHTKPDLYDANVNAWLADQPDRRFLIRALHDTGAGRPGVLRAVLSDSYRIVDNLDVLMTALAGIRAAGAAVDITSADLTETHMYLKVRSTEIAEHAPALLENYRSPFTGARGSDNPLVWAGFVLSNSETGAGSFKIAPQITVQICNNGMTLTRHVLKEVHLGGKLPAGQIRWAADTQRAALEVVTKRARDAVATFLDRDFVRAQIAEITADAGVEIRKPAETIEHVARTLHFTTEQQDLILNHFIAGGDPTSGGVLHAVTSAAQLTPDADTAHEMERQGLRAMTLAAAHATRAHRPGTGAGSRGAAGPGVGPGRCWPGG